MRVFQMSIQAGALIVVIAALRAIALHKLPKTAFLALWGVALVRLLVPFSLSSRFSVYTIAEAVLGSNSASMTPSPEAALPHNNPVTGEMGVLDIPAQAIGSQAVSIDLLGVVWAIGMAAAFFFVAVVYWRSCRELRFAWHVRENGCVDAWLNGRKLLRPLSVLQSDTLTTPVAAGFLRPRIILPSTMDMRDERLLRHVLTHEYYHIRRFDAVWKLLVIFALCVHWFNPLVWVLAILVNRDLEITCDEMVVRHFGADAKTAYARSLIGMAEQRIKLAPLHSGFGENAAEERIKVIMKYKKASFAAMAAALVLIVGVTTVFATSAKESACIPYDGADGVIVPSDTQAWALVSQLYAVDTSLSVSQYHEEVLSICGGDVGVLFDVLVDATTDMAEGKVESGNALAAFVTNSLTYTSHEIYAGLGINPLERPYARIVTEWIEYLSDEAFDLLAGRENFTDEEWTEYTEMLLQEGGLPHLDKYVGIDFYIFYEIPDEAAMTIERRNGAIAAVADAMQRYMDDAGEEERFDAGFYKAFEAELKAVTEAYATDEMRMEYEMGTVDQMVE